MLFNILVILGWLSVTFYVAWRYPDATDGQLTLWQASLIIGLIIIPMGSAVFYFRASLWQRKLEETSDPSKLFDPITARLLRALQKWLSIRKKR